MVRAPVATAIIFIASIFLVGVGRAQGPSFNCLTNNKPDETTVCGSSMLSRLDVELNGLYTALRESLDTNNQLLLRDTQRGWLRKRSACQYDVRCISALYQTRITALKQMLAPVSAEPPRTTPTTTDRPATDRPVPRPTGGRDACDIFPTLC
jgi:uncharacterized protein